MESTELPAQLRIADSVVFGPLVMPTEAGIGSKRASSKAAKKCLTCTRNSDFCCYVYNFWCCCCKSTRTYR